MRPRDVLSSRPCVQSPAGPLVQSCVVFNFTVVYSLRTLFGLEPVLFVINVQLLTSIILNQVYEFAPSVVKVRSTYCVTVAIAYKICPTDLSQITNFSNIHNVPPQKKF